MASTEDILYLDCRQSGNMAKLQRALKKIGPLAKCKDENVPLEMVEKAIDAMCSKYAVSAQYIMFSRVKGERTSYTASVRTDYDFGWAGSVYGATIYEVVVKLAIKIYAMIKFENLPLRKRGEEE